MRAATQTSTMAGKHMHLKAADRHARVALGGTCNSKPVEHSVALPCHTAVLPALTSQETACAAAVLATHSATAMVFWFPAPWTRRADPQSTKQSHGSARLLCTGLNSSPFYRAGTAPPLFGRYLMRVAAMPDHHPRWRTALPVRRGPAAWHRSTCALGSEEVPLRTHRPARTWGALPPQGEFVENQTLLYLPAP